MSDAPETPGEAWVRTGWINGPQTPDEAKLSDQEKGHSKDCPQDIYPYSRLAEDACTCKHR